MNGLLMCHCLQFTPICCCKRQYCHAIILSVPAFPSFFKPILGRPTHCLETGGGSKSITIATSCGRVHVCVAGGCKIGTCRQTVTLQNHQPLCCMYPAPIMLKKRHSVHVPPTPTLKEIKSLDSVRVSLALHCDEFAGPPNQAAPRTETPSQSRTNPELA